MAPDWAEAVSVTTVPAATLAGVPPGPVTTRIVVVLAADAKAGDTPVASRSRRNRR